MEGAQHNTMDVEYYGPNPQMGFWYLGALRACEEMANYLGEKDYADQCRGLYLKGSAWIDENLFNGEYYEHMIMPPLKKENVAPSLLLDMGSDDLTKPDYQLGKGVLVDQLIGQLMSHFVGLGYLGKEQNIKKTLQSIMKYNYRENLAEHVNVMRSYALSDESALLMAAYPVERPKTPFPYFTEVMTGFEYTAAIGMLYEGQIDNGLKCIQNIRNRYDGRKRGIPHVCCGCLHSVPVFRLTAANENALFGLLFFMSLCCHLKYKNKMLALFLSVFSHSLHLSPFM